MGLGKSIVAISLLIFLIGSSISADGLMPLRPTVTLSEMDPPERTAEVSFDSIGTAMFSATVTVEKPPAVGTVMVQLDGSTSTGWVTVVSPQSIPFTASGSVGITITVVVPQATPSSIVGRVTVSALGTYPGGSSSDTTSATVRVKQYYRIQMDCSPKVGMENPQTFAINVSNRGNGEDSFKFSLPFQEAMGKLGLTIDFEQASTKPLTQDTNDTIHVTVSYGSSAPSGSKQIYVRATSSASIASGNDSVYKDIVVVINVQPWHGTAGVSLGVVALIIIIVVVVVLFVAKKKGKLRFPAKKQATKPERTEEKKE